MFSALKRLPIWLVMFTCATTYSQIHLLDTPLFTEAGTPVAICAAVDGNPAAVQLNWTSDQQNGQLNLTQNAAGNWSVVFPTSSAQGNVIHYTLVADFDTDGSVTSSPYVLYICSTFIELQPAPMTLNQNVIVRKKWNSNDAFALTVNQEGPVTGPASIACDDSSIYVLDNAKKRIVSFDHKGSTASFKRIVLPTSKANDLIINPTDNSFVVVSQLEDKVYHIKKNGRLKQTRSVDKLRKMTYPAKFSFNASDDALFAQKTVTLKSPHEKWKKTRRSSMKHRDINSSWALTASRMCSL